MIARLPGVRSAPPMPWSVRVIMRTSALGAIPQSAEETANQAIPIMKTRLRPKWSPREPPSKSSAARVRV